MIGRGSDPVDLTRQLAKFEITPKDKMKRGTKATASAKKKKKAVVLDRGFLQLNCPHIFYKWRDERKNEMLTLEVLMNGPLSHKNCSAELIESGGGEQILSVKYNLPTSWVSEDYYSKNNEVDSWNGSRRFEARCGAIKALEDDYGQGRNAQLVYEQAFSLPFRCDNFDKDPVYTGTGYCFQQWSVLSRRANTNQNRNGFTGAHIDGMLDALVVTLVAEDKYQVTKKTKKTPQKQVFVGAFEDNLADKELAFLLAGHGGGRANRHEVDMNIDAQNSNEAREASRQGFSYSHEEMRRTSHSSRSQRRRTDDTQSRASSRSERGTQRTASMISRDEQDENEDGGNFGRSSLEIAVSGRGRESFETAQYDDDDQTMNTDGISFS